MIDFLLCRQCQFLVITRQHRHLYRIITTSLPRQHLSLALHDSSPTFEVSPVVGYSWYRLLIAPASGLPPPVCGSYPPLINRFAVCLGNSSIWQQEPSTPMSGLHAACLAQQGVTFREVAILAKSQLPGYISCALTPKGPRPQGCVATRDRQGEKHFHRSWWNRYLRHQSCLMRGRSSDATRVADPVW